MVWRAAVDALLKNYPALLKTLQNISETCYDDYGRKANGLNAPLEKFDTYFGLKLSHLIFSGTEQAIALQGKCKRPSAVLKLHRVISAG